jgi:methionyl-tRNA synthetase
LSWGIPFPFSPDHVVYVWFDALVNYISAVGFGYDDKRFKKYWPAEIHLIGKDILRQHAIYWPIMLKALGLEPPAKIFAHGWWMVGEDKMSKSKGNVVDPRQVVKDFGVDAYRYFLLREVNLGSDGNFSYDALTQRYNSDLANDLGNLVHRTTTMIEKYFDGDAAKLNSKITNHNINQKLAGIHSELDSDFQDLNLSGCLVKIWELINIANKHVEETRPWELSRENRSEELKIFISDLYLVLKEVAGLLEPFIPETSAKISAILNSQIIKKGEPLFPRREIK